MKKILFIGTKFHNFQDHLIKQFKQLDYDVTYYSDRPSEKTMMKSILKLNKNFAKKSINAYFNKMIKNIENESFDIVFLLNGKVFDYEMISKIKANQPKAKFVYYTWDSIELYPHITDFFELFDCCYTFDYADSLKFDKLELLPLFYTDGYKEIATKKEISEYDLASVCTAHPNRYKIIAELFPKLKNKGINIYSYLYINKFQYIYNKVKVEEFKKAKLNEFMFETLSEEENIDIMRKSRVIFDINHNQQTGLTIRTIEALGAKRKLITTNHTIQKYDFYNPKNIFILKNNYDELFSFIDIEYEEIPNTVYESYSIEKWAEIVTGNSTKSTFLN